MTFRQRKIAERFSLKGGVVSIHVLDPHLVTILVLPSTLGAHLGKGGVVTTAPRSHEIPEQGQDDGVRGTGDARRYSGLVSQ